MTITGMQAWLWKGVAIDLRYHSLIRRRAAAKINNEKRSNEGILEGIDISKPHLSTVKPVFLLYSFEM